MPYVADFDKQAIIKTCEEEFGPGVECGTVVIHGQLAVLYVHEMSPVNNRPRLGLTAQHTAEPGDCRTSEAVWDNNGFACTFRSGWETTAIRRYMMWKFKTHPEWKFL